MVFGDWSCMSRSKILPTNLLQSHELKFCVCVSEVYHIQPVACCAPIHPQQREAVSLIWGIHSKQLLFINTPLWCTSLSSLLLLLCLSLPHTHAPLKLYGLLCQTKTYTRGYITKTMSIMKIPHSPQTPSGTSTNCSHCWHSSRSLCFQCHGFTKQVVLIIFTS